MLRCEQLESRTLPATLLGWDVNGLSGFGASPLAATTSDAGLTSVAGLTRGSTVTTSGSAAGSCWGGNNWSQTTAADGDTGNQFATFGFSVAAGETVSLTSIDAWMRRSTSGPANVNWEYKIGSGSFTQITAQTNAVTSTTGGGNQIPEVNLSGIAALQNLSGTSVTIRITPYGAGGSTTNWYVSNGASGNDVVLSGTATTASGSSTSAVGLNFAGGSGSSFAPPDTDGAIGPNDYTQLINGRFAVYCKTDGSQVLAETDTAFWNAAGISSTVTNAGLSDTRVIYDPRSGRWFASEINTATTGNQVLVGRSDTDDPSGTWQAVSFTANAGFGDFPTLAVDAHAVIIGLNNFTDGTANGTFKSVSVTTIPKADLIQDSPTAANRTTVEQTNAAIGYTPQGVTNNVGDPGYSSIVALNATTLSRINRTTATGTGAASATFGSTSVLTTQTTSLPGLSRQPDGTRQLDGDDLRIPAVVYQVGDLIYTAYGVSVKSAGVATTAGASTTNAIRVTVLRDSTNTVVAEGTWSSASFDYSYPSLIANQFGDILIGFTRSSATAGSGATNGNAGAYAVQARIDPANPTALTFIGSDIQLKAGLVSNYHLFGGNGERWGDFSATNLDPANPLAFWTTQEYTVASNTWGTQISQVFVAPRETGVNSSAADGTYGVGATIPITVTFTGPVTVSGTPTLTLNSGGTAAYASGSGTSTLVFDYTVASGQNAADLDYTSTTALALAGGSIKDTTSNLNADLTLAAPGAAGSLGANKDLVIDAGLIATTTTITQNTPNPSTSGQTVNFTVSVSPAVPNGESVSLEDADNGNTVVGSGTLTSGTATIGVSSLAVGTHHVFAVYAGDATDAASQSASVSQIVNASGGGTLTLRIADYNIASSGGSPRSGLDTILKAIGDEATYNGAHPLDILALQEVESQSTTTQAVVNLLNAIYGSGTYARGTVNGASLGSGTEGVVYRTSTVQLVSETAFGTISSSGIERQPIRYKFHTLGTASANDFYVYNSHYKADSAASDQSQRQVEAAAIRANADALGQGANILYVGDFNVYTSSEAMFGTLTAAGNGHAIDPINRVGDWHGSPNSFRDILTQAPANSPPGGLTGGGLDDRFDFELVSDEVKDGSGFDYKSGTYHTFGNNGSVAVNGNINDSSSTALPGLSNRTTVLNLLTTVTDHLPVVADFTVPAANNAPTITSGASFNVAENTTTVATMTATDPDSGQALSWSISGGADAAKFHIDSSSGALTFVAAPDYENPTDSGADDVYNVVVQATDNGSPALSASKAVAVTVTDVATGSFQFDSATYSTAEGDSGTHTVTITVDRTGGTDAASVDYATQTSPGTASAGSDYDATSGTLNFAAGDTSKTFTVTIHGDTDVEPDETVYISLSNATVGGFVGTPGTTVLTITNDDNGPAPAVTGVEVNGGPIAAVDALGDTPDLADQNSVVEQLLVTFNEAVTLDSGAFAIDNLFADVTVNGGLAPSHDAVGVVVTAVSGSSNTQYVLTFTGGVNTIDNSASGNGGVGNVFTTIKDGFYQLNVDGSKVHANSQTASSTTAKFWAVYGANNPGDFAVSGTLGDGNSEVTVGNGGLGDLYAGYGSESDIDGPYLAPYDYNLDGFIDNGDLSPFYSNYGIDWSF